VQLKNPVRVVDVLGLLTIAAYGSWFYGFGVLVGDISADLGVGIGTLGVVFGATTLVGGGGAIAVGRLLDHKGPHLVLRVIGPSGAIIYATLPLTSNALVFSAAHVVGGGLISASAFYSFTQPMAMRVRPRDPMRAVTRLTIWGALASPIAIPLTEAARRHVSWRGAMHISGLALCCVYFLSAWTLRGGLIAHVRPRPTDFRLVVASLTNSAFLTMYALSGFLASVSIAALLVFQVPVMKWAGLSASAAASFAGARGLLQLMGRLPLLPLVVRFGAWRLQHLSKLAIVFGAVMLWMSASPVLAGVYVVVVGASAGALSALDGMVGHDILPPENFATSVAILGFVATIGSAVGPIFVGVLVQWSSLGSVPIFVMATSAVAFLVQDRSHRLRASNT
jgi:MFS family permease